MHKRIASRGNLQFLIKTTDIEPIEALACREKNLIREHLGQYPRPGYGCNRSMGCLVPSKPPV
jgi:hypothetical protein